MDGHAVQLQNGCGYSFNADYMEKYVAVCEKCGYQGTFYDKCPKCGSKDIQINGWDDYTENISKSIRLISVLVVAIYIMHLILTMLKYMAAVMMMNTGEKSFHSHIR